LTYIIGGEDQGRTTGMLTAISINECKEGQWLGIKQK
jgi:hypothetical protein